MIWTEGLERLKIFVDYLNKIHPTIKFTSSHSLINVPFLDIMMSLHNCIIETDLFTKPTDKHQHLLSSSCHPHHTKKAIPFSLAPCLPVSALQTLSLNIALMNLKHISLLVVIIIIPRRTVPTRC